MIGGEVVNLALSAWYFHLAMKGITTMSSVEPLGTTRLLTITIKDDGDTDHECRG